MPAMSPGVGVRAMYFLLFVYVGAQGNFLPLWLKSVGWSETETGFVFSLRYVTIILVPVAWGALADRRGAAIALRLIAIGSALCFIPLLLTGAVLWVTLALTAFSLFRVGIVAVTDALTLAHIESYGGHFGRYRQWGSFGFIAGGFLLGLVVQHLGGREAIPAGLWAILLATIAVVYVLPHTPPAAAPGRMSDRWASMRRLASVGWMRRFLAVVFLWRLSSQGLYTMLPLHLERLGVSDDWLPTYWAVGVVSEVVMFRMAPRWFEPRGRKAVLLLCLTSCALQYLLLAMVTDRIAVAFVMLLHGLSFGMAYYTCVTWLGESVEADIRAASQGLFQVVAFGIGGALSTVGAGLLYQAGQGALLFSVASSIAAVALAAGAVLLRASDGWHLRAP